MLVSMPWKKLFIRESENILVIIGLLTYNMYVLRNINV